ncbi:protein turtle homolog B [Misgurnus anguillicaudatus]|uniref:protein turtle homolog B n=1 Tax=Misgurnus anguillicaudatus TaxID=75329 RepID=UPI003CCF2230
MTSKTLPVLEVLIVAVLCLYNHTSATDDIVHAKIGGTAILTCILPDPGLVISASQHVIEWVRLGYDIPILIQFGIHDPRVHPNYDGRVSLIGGSSLQVRGLLLDDEGWYECRVLPLDKPTDEFRSNGHQTLLSVTAPPIFTETLPSVVEVFLGRSAILKCATRGNPQPMITWFKDGVTIKPQSKVKIVNGSLSFTAVSRDSRGLYQCHVSNTEGNVTHITELKVIGPPEIIIPPSDTVLYMNQNAKLKCQAEADPPNMTYVWQRNGQDIYHIESLKSRVKVIVDGTLQISHLTPEDSGNYTCMPTNGLPVSPSASAILTVQHPAQVMHMPKLTYLATGMKGVISCPFRSEPPLSHVDWTKDGKPLYLGMYPGWTLTSDGSIVIATANDDAAGVYTCTPFNSIGTMGKSEPTTVKLEDPPSFQVSPRKEYMEDAGQMLLIPCQMDGNPAPKVTWRKVGGSSRSQFSVKADGSLILQPLIKDHQGEWECSSSNRVATVSVRTTVFVLGTSPHAVSSVSVIPGINEANVSWVPGFDGGSNQKFTVWYKQMSAEKKEERQEWMFFPVLSTDNSMLVTDLLPATEYQFRVIAQNKAGSGPYSEITTIKTLETSPVVTELEPPTSLSVNQSSEGFVLWWSMPQSPTNDGFVVQSRFEGGEWRNLKEDISPNERQIFLRGLCKDCKYELRLLSQYGDQLSMPSPSISVSTVGMDPVNSPILEFPNTLLAGVMGGVGLLCIVLLLTLAIVCFVFYKRGKRHRENKKDLPPAKNKKPPTNPDSTMEKLLPARPLSITSTSSGHSSLDKSTHNDFHAQRQQQLPQANPPSHHSIPESHLQRASLAPMSSVEFIHRGPDGRFNVEEDASSHMKRNLSQNSHRSSEGNRSVGIKKSQSLRSYRDDRKKPPFVLSVDLPPFGSDIPSSNRTRAMAKHLSLNGHYMPIREQEFLGAPDLTSLCSETSSFFYPNSESTFGQQSLKQVKVHSAASALVLQMEHEREQGNLSRCLSLAREREELERELRRYTVNPNQSIQDVYGEIYKTRETSTPLVLHPGTRNSFLSDNTSILKGRSASCIPWEERHRLSSASLVPLHTLYEKDNRNRHNQYDYHTMQRSSYHRSKSLDRGERQKSYTWDQRRSRTPVDTNFSRVIDESVEKAKPYAGYSQKNSRESQQYFDQHIYTPLDDQQEQRMARSSRQINPGDDYSEVSVDGPEHQSQVSLYSRSLVDPAHSYETLDYERPSLPELEKVRSKEQKLESGNVGSRRTLERLNRTLPPKDFSGTMIRKTKSLGSNNLNRHRSTHSLDSRLHKEQFLPPDAWVDSLTLGRGSTMPSFGSRALSVTDQPKSSLILQTDSLVKSECQLRNHNHQSSKSLGGSTKDSEYVKVSERSKHSALSPEGSSWPLSYCPSLTSGSRSQSQDEEREDVDVEINSYRKSSETDGSYRSYASSKSSGRGSMDAPNVRQFSLSPPFTSSPETTEDSDRDETGLQEPEMQERSRRDSVDESYEWDSAYIRMHPVDPKASLSKAVVQREFFKQGKQSTIRDDYRPELDLKQKGLSPPAGFKEPSSPFVVPNILSSRREQESVLAQKIRESSTAFPEPEPDTVLF